MSRVLLAMTLVSVCEQNMLAQKYRTEPGSSLVLGVSPADMKYDRFRRQKGGDLTQSYDKSPYTDRNVKRASDNTKNATKKFD